MSLKKISYRKKLSRVMKQLVDGAFLTTSTDNEINTMTIGWGSIGYIWNRPVFTVLVRESRYTYKMLNRSKAFTVSLPLQGQLTEELAYCGSKSGENCDKFNDLDLDTLPGRILSTPFIAECDIFYECRTVCRNRVQSPDVEDKIEKNSYSDGDYHTIYHGEILAAYRKE